LLLDVIDRLHRRAHWNAGRREVEIVDFVVLPGSDSRILP
jgi:hypothetical protein